MNVHIVDNDSSIAVAWEELCVANGYFLQSRYNDEVTNIYNSKFYFICVTDNAGKLIGGCKIVVNESRLLPAFMRSISRVANQYCEYILSPGLNTDESIHVSQLITKEIDRFIATHKIASFVVKGFYGDATRLYNTPHFNYVTHLNIGIVDLTQSIETLWNNIHPKHRNKIRKAEKEGVQIVCNDDFDTLKKMLFEMYARQTGVKKPGESFLNRFFEVISKLGHNYIYVCYYNNEVAGAALILPYGSRAEYMFAGTNKLHPGANNLMQWHIMQDMKAKGCLKYSFGSVASEGEEYNNPKFEDGISSFKKRFGCTLYPTYNAEYIVTPLKYKLWKQLVRIRNM